MIRGQSCSRAFSRIVAAAIMIALCSLAASVMGLCRVDVAFADSTVEMHRVYNPNSGEHFYTASTDERDSLVRCGWAYEGTGWVAPTQSKTPVYRLYSGTDHHYTTSAAERDSLLRVGWTDEGIGWYSDDSRTVPLYRQFNPNVNPRAKTNNSGSHNYTTSLGEHNYLVSAGWRGEGIAWYAKAEGEPAAPTGVNKAYAEEKIEAFFAEYPEGTSWTNENRVYHPQGRPNWTYYGCAAYAFMLQDEIFGTRPYMTSEDVNTVKPYDVVWIGYYHWAFVLSVDKAHRTMTIAEGNFNNSVHIGRVIPFDGIVEVDTRY